MAVAQELHLEAREAAGSGIALGYNLAFPIFGGTARWSPPG
jgi:hypothetical protein